MFTGNWHFFLIAILIAGASAYMYNRFTFPTFLTATTLMIEEEQIAVADDCAAGQRPPTPRNQRSKKCP